MGEAREILRRGAHAPTPSRMATTANSHTSGETHTTRQSPKTRIQSQARLRNRSCTSQKRRIAQDTPEIWTQTQTHGSPQVQTSQEPTTNRRGTRSTQIPQHGSVEQLLGGRRRQIKMVRNHTRRPKQ